MVGIALCFSDVKIGVSGPPPKGCWRGCSDVEGSSLASPMQQFQVQELKAKRD